MPFDLGYPPARSRLARPGYDGTSVQDAARHFSSEEACFDHVVQTRYGDSIACLRCGRTGRWYRRKGAKYIQHPCGAVISPLAGTLFHGTKLPLRLWFYAMLHFANSQEGVNGAFLGRHLGISYVAAFRLAQRIRLHLAELERLCPVAGPRENVEVRLETLHRVRSGTASPNVAHVMFVARGGKVDCEIVSACRRHIALAAIAKVVPQHGDLFTTCYRTANLLSAYGARRARAAYFPCYYQDRPDEVDVIKGFLSYFLWPFYIHHKHVSRTHLSIYLKEFQFRYNRRHRSAQTYWDMIGAFPTLPTDKTSRPGSDDLAMK